MWAKGQISLMQYLNGDRPIVHWLLASQFSLVSLSCLSCLSCICWTSFDSCLTVIDYLHYPFFSLVPQISLATLASLVSLVYFVSFIFLIFTVPLMSIEYSCFSYFPVPLVSQIPTNWWELKEDKWQTTTQALPAMVPWCLQALLASTPDSASPGGIGEILSGNLRQTWDDGWLWSLFSNRLWLRFFSNPLKLSYHHPHLNNYEWYNDCRTERNLRKGNSQWFSLCICHSPRLMCK